MIIILSFLFIIIHFFNRLPEIKDNLTKKVSDEVASNNTEKSIN